VLTDRENFKFAFMSRCIEEGVTTPTEIHQTVKRAIDELENPPQEKQAFLGPAIEAISRMGSMALPIALAAPPILGAGAGYMAARAGDVDDADVEEVKRQELIQELRRQTQKIQRRRAR
jgi:hypothetical protein